MYRQTLQLMALSSPPSFAIDVKSAIEVNEKEKYSKTFAIKRKQRTEIQAFVSRTQNFLIQKYLYSCNGRLLGSERNEGTSLALGILIS